MTDGTCEGSAFALPIGSKGPEGALCLLCVEHMLGGVLLSSLLLVFQRFGARHADGQLKTAVGPGLGSASPLLPPTASWVALL